MRRRGALTVSTPILVGLLAATLAGCGEEGSSLADREIVEALKLEKPDEGEGYLLDGDPFCVVAERFFKGAGEVEAAKGDEDTGVVVASRAGNVALEGVPTFFDSSCRKRARHRLDKLDPPAADG